MTRRRLLTVFLLVLIVAGACGDDDATTQQILDPSPPDCDYQQTTVTAAFCLNEATVDFYASHHTTIASRMQAYLIALSGLNDRPITFRPIDGTGEFCVYRQYEVVAEESVARALDPADVEDTGRRIGAFSEYWVLSSSVDAFDFATMTDGVIPHYVLPMTQEYKWGPGDAPVPVPGAAAPDDPAIDVAGAKVVVFDVGRWTGEGGLSDDLDDDDYLDPVAGHGNFVASIIEERSGEGVLLIDPRDPDDGINDLQSFDSAVRQAFSDGLLSQPPYVVNLSFASPACGPLDPTAVMRLTINDLLSSGSLIVAAAGNDKSQIERYPAAFSVDEPCAVVAVGALDGGVEAEFSNFGPWVTAWAPGVDVVGPYPKGEISYVSGLEGQTHGVTAESFGVVSWSGTSFATPYVTAAIASSTDDPRDAWAGLTTAQDLDDWHVDLPPAVMCSVLVGE